MLLVTVQQQRYVMTVRRQGRTTLTSLKHFEVSLSNFHIIFRVTHGVSNISLSSLPRIWHHGHCIKTSVSSLTPLRHHASWHIGHWSSRFLVSILICDTHPTRRTYLHVHGYWLFHRICVHCHVTLAPPISFLANTTLEHSHASRSHHWELSRPIVLNMPLKIVYCQLVGVISPHLWYTVPMSSSLAHFG